MATPNDIYNEITRIDNAKQGIAEAIEEKGVQVPAGTPIQDFPGKVRQIRQGSETAVEYTPQDLTPEQQAQARTNIGAGTYSKPNAGIPDGDLSQSVQASLEKAESAYQKPGSGIPETDLSQGVQTSLEKANTAVQPAALNEITDLIPEQATPENKLADKNFVNSSIATNTANYISDNGQPFQSVADLEAYTGPLTNNDYAFVVGTDSAGNTIYTRYKYNATTQTWAAEYVLNNSSFTAAQWAAISSGITALLVQKLSGLPTEIVTYVSQTLTEAQKQQARTNIGAGTYSKPENGIPNTDLAGKFAGSPTAGGPANRAFGIPFGDVITGSTATDIKATVNNFPEELTNGVCAYIRNNIVASASGWTLNVNGTGAKPVYVSNADATRSTTTFSASVTYLFIYNETRIEGGCWDMYYGYNANDNTIGYNLRTNTMSLPVTSACYRYRLLFTSADKKQFVPANASTSTNATSKRTTTQTPIDPFGSIRYYSYTTAVSTGNRPGAAYLWEQYLITLGYSFNRTGAALELTPWKPVYIKCAPLPDDSAIIDAETPYVQDLPTYQDGKIYIYLGVATSATQVEVVYYHPVYYNNGYGLVKWSGSANQIKRVDVDTNDAPNVYILGTQIEEIKFGLLYGVFGILLTIGNFLKVESCFATLNWNYTFSAYSIQYKPTSGNYGLLDVTHANDDTNRYIEFNGITFNYNSENDRYETDQWPTS